MSRSLRAVLFRDHPEHRGPAARGFAMTQPTRPVPTRELTAELVDQIGDLIAIAARLH